MLVCIIEQVLAETREFLNVWPLAWIHGVSSHYCSSRTHIGTGSGLVNNRWYSTYRRSKRLSIISLMRQDVVLERVNTGHDPLALLIGECSVVFMRRAGELVTGAGKLLDFMSEA
jgi:hypothetical protein